MFPSEVVSRGTSLSPLFLSSRRDLERPIRNSVHFPLGRLAALASARTNEVIKRCWDLKKVRSDAVKRAEEEGVWAPRRAVSRGHFRPRRRGRARPRFSKVNRCVAGCAERPKITVNAVSFCSPIFKIFVARSTTSHHTCAHGAVGDRLLKTASNQSARRVA